MATVTSSDLPVAILAGGRATRLGDIAREPPRF